MTMTMLNTFLMLLTALKNSSTLVKMKLIVAMILMLPINSFKTKQR